MADPSLGLSEDSRVYVDRLPDHGWGKWNGGAHMLANDIHALHATAVKIGLRPDWFQADSTFTHYDLTASKRRLAVASGAIEIELGEIPDDVLMRGVPDSEPAAAGRRR